MSARAARVALAAVVVGAVLVIAVVALPRLASPGPSTGAASAPSSAAVSPAAAPEVAPDLTTVTGTGYAIGLPAAGVYSLMPAAGGDAWFGFGPTGPQGVWVAPLGAEPSTGTDGAADDPVADSRAAAEELAGLLGGMPGGATADPPIPLELPVGSGQRVDISTGSGRFVAVVIDTADGPWRLLFVNQTDVAIDAILRSFAPGRATP